MITNFVTENRIGKFYISDRLIQDAPEEVLKALAGCIVVRAERLWDRYATEYVAFSPYFDKVPKEVWAAEYTGEFKEVYNDATAGYDVIFSGWEKVQP